MYVGVRKVRTLLVGWGDLRKKLKMIILPNRFAQVDWGSSKLISIVVVVGKYLEGKCESLQSFIDHRLCSIEINQVSTTENDSIEVSDKFYVDHEGHNEINLSYVFNKSSEK